MTQMLLFPDPRPLVERLGLEFFRQAPECPGVYLMRDAAGSVLYVGKAKSLKKRLGSYRVANPDRMRRRHLRLLRAVARIELEELPDEASALARESELLLGLRPRFNRAGTWPGARRFLALRLTEAGIALAVAEEKSEAEWVSPGPLAAAGMGGDKTLSHVRQSFVGGPVSATRAKRLLTVLARLLWCALHPECRLEGMPEGWLSGRQRENATIANDGSAPACMEELEMLLGSLFTGHPEEFAEWVRKRTATWSHPFELAVKEADLEEVGEAIAAEV